VRCLHSTHLDSRLRQQLLCALGDVHVPLLDDIQVRAVDLKFVVLFDSTVVSMLSAQESGEAYTQKIQHTSTREARDLLPMPVPTGRLLDCNAITPQAWRRAYQHGRVRSPHQGGLERHLLYHVQGHHGRALIDVPGALAQRIHVDISKLEV